MRQGRLDSATHLSRAAEHERVADALADAGHEWSAVCYFYAAYHLVKAAMLEDAIFDDPTQCQALHPDLLPDDRYVSRHKGRRRTSEGREWGLNELVLVLYRPAAGKYERLHSVSNDVRYHDGLAGTVADVRGVYEEFKALVDGGALSTGRSPRT